MKTYRTQYMREYAQYAQDMLQMDVTIGHGLQFGQDYAYPLTIDGQTITWPVIQDSRMVTGQRYNEAPSEAIVGFLWALIWLGPDVARDIIAHGYDHSIDHDTPEDART